ncbi:hypothetical protein [Pseudomonas corrugata]
MPIFYVLSIAVASFYASLIISFWLAVRRFGKLKAAYRLEWQVFNFDVIGASWASLVLFWAAYDWLNLPAREFESWECCLYAVISAIATVGMGYFNGRERFTNPTHAGIAESALRFLAVRHIITAAEVSHALRTMPLTTASGVKK